MSEPCNHPFPGTVTDTPHYIRVRSSWVDRLLLAAVLFQIMLAGIFLTYGSSAARSSEEIDRGNRALLCARIFDVSPDLYDRYLDYCPPRVR